MKNKNSITIIILLVGIALGGMLMTGFISNNNNHYTQAFMAASETHAAKTEQIYFAGGCFWGTEHFFKQINGVVATKTGYANGHTENPSYKEVLTSRTGFAETVKVTYDPEVVDLKLLLELYFKTVDPTSSNRQGNDTGTQYRTGIYFTNKTILPIIRRAVEELSTQYDKPIVIEVEPLKNFHAAEDYHQDYLDKNPGGYCHIDPSLFKMANEANQKVVYKKKDKKTLHTELTKEQYDVTQNNATERAFANAYWDEFREGIYVDITTGEPLFVSTDKFESGCGWPSFSKPIDESLLAEKDDRTLGMQRAEVRSKTGNAHLGHVFNDGPKDKGGRRYCINSASLKFIPKAEMEKEGYGKYIVLIKKEI
ncbi:MAG: peptide-methionine (R)-S-oxide reductase MsrB [Sphingobacterium sp.]